MTHTLTHTHTHLYRKSLIFGSPTVGNTQFQTKSAIADGWIGGEGLL